jgi:hypothetical protein
MNLVSLFLGELGVSSHQRSFGLVIEETLPSLPQLASQSTAKVALAS